MHVVHVWYLWASLHRSDCVLLIVGLQQRPLEDVRESRLRSVTEHHCRLKNTATKKKKSPSVHCLALLNHFPHLTYTHTLSPLVPQTPLSP